MSTAHNDHPGKLLCHPAVLVAVAVVAINDHLLKGSGLLPGVVTGKLSDVAGLFFFPVLVAVLFYLAVRLAGLESRFWRRPQVLVDAAVVVTVAGFTAVNVVEPVNAVAAQVWGVFTMDPTDLFCLPMVVVARQFALRRWPAEKTEEQRIKWRFRWPHYAVIFVASAVSIATPAPTHTTLTVYPHWFIVGDLVECHHDVEITSWFAKTGKEGAGMVLRFDDTLQKTREVVVERAVMRIGEFSDGEFVEGLEVGARTVDPATVDRRASVYLPFAFNNQRAWKDKSRAGVVEVELRIDGAPARLSYEVEQIADGQTRVYRLPHARQGGAAHRHRPESRQAQGTSPEPLLEAPDAPGGYAISMESMVGNGCSEAGDDSEVGDD